MDSDDRQSPQIDAREAHALQVGRGNMQFNFMDGGLRPPDLARRHLYFEIGSSAGAKFNMIPPMPEPHRSKALSDFLAGLEQVGVPPHQLEAIRARADDVAAAPARKQFDAAVFAFTVAVNDVTNVLRERSVGDEFDWFKLADLIVRISLIGRAQWPEGPTEEGESMRANLYALAERLDVPASVRSEIQGFASMKLPTATLDEFTDAAIRLQKLCYGLL